MPIPIWDLAFQKYHPMRNLSYHFLLVPYLFGFFSACTPAESASTRQLEITEATTPAADMTLDELLTEHQGYDRIPLKKMSSGHLHLEVSLNGKTGNFILDTGAGASVLEDKRKTDYNVTAVKSKIVATGTGGGAIGMQVSSKNTLQIGNLEIPNSTIYLMPLDHLNKAFLGMKLKEIDGIIGADVLTSQKGIIDYANLVLYLRN